jgi:hypothetical protein
MPPVPRTGARPGGARAASTDGHAVPASSGRTGRSSRSPLGPRSRLGVELLGAGGIELAVDQQERDECDLVERGGSCYEGSSSSRAAVQRSRRASESRSTTGYRVHHDRAWLPRPARVLRLDDPPTVGGPRRAHPGIVPRRGISWQHGPVAAAAGRRFERLMVRNGGPAREVLLDRGWHGPARESVHRTTSHSHCIHDSRSS